MGNRVRSDDVTLSWASPLGPATGFGNIQSAELELMFELLRERYLGRTTEDKDELFKGVKGSASLHFETSQPLAFMQLVQDRAQRRTAASGKFTAIYALRFPGGTRARLILDDLHFDTMPLRIPQGGGYLDITLSFECSEIRRFL